MEENDIQKVILHELPTKNVFPNSATCVGAKKSVMTVYMATSRWMMSLLKDNSKE
jgi:hypothetical protein